ncbi:MAG: pyridoxal-phosphate dependent enzyme [Gemmatimonadota bacterium]|nr:pyridoxal-phosphate dependent enzyme [Gemmatimonadota bacterium]
MAPSIRRTPLLPLEGARMPCSMHLKLESLQPIGSFKLRGAANAMALADGKALQRGVYTGSAGNMAQGIAYAARERGIACRVIVPETAPETKIRAIEHLGATCVPVPYEEWWSILQNHGDPEEPGFFIHPVADASVIAGNGTIGLEILEDLPEVDAVVVPFGGGGLSCGIASAVKAARPDVRVFAAEVETAAPFAASLRAGAPMSIERVPSFVDGIGGSSVLPEMWPLASNLLDGSIVVGLEEVRNAVRMLVRDSRIVAEGAGAAALAAALTGAAGGGTVAVVISGGNIDASVLADILSK